MITATAQHSLAYRGILTSDGPVLVADTARVGSTGVTGALDTLQARHQVGRAAEAEQESQTVGQH